MTKKPPDNMSSRGPDRSKPLLDRAFNGPETKSPTNDRTSWLDGASDDQPHSGNDDRHFDAPAKRGADGSGQNSRLLRIAGLGALVVMAFVAGYFVRQTNTETTVVVLAEPTAATVTPSTSTPAPSSTATSSSTPNTVEPEPVASAEPPSAVVSFSRGTSTISEAAVELIVGFLEAQPADATIVLVGSGDTGTDGPLNDALGQLRAETVADRLESLGVASDALVVATNRDADLGDGGTVLVLSR